jgi:hypothetical protein
MQPATPINLIPFTAKATGRLDFSMHLPPLALLSLRLAGGFGRLLLTVLPPGLHTLFRKLAGIPCRSESRESRS